MEITLRRANAIQETLKELIDSVDVVFAITLNEFQEAGAQIEDARTIATKMRSRILSLVDARFEIREKIGAANATAGVNHLLSEIAKLSKLIDLHTGWAAAKPASDMVVVEGSLKRYRESTEAYRGVVMANILTAEHIEMLNKELASLKRRKQVLNDQVLELNVRTEIELSNETVGLLKSDAII